MLKRSIEESGRSPTVTNYAVAIWLAALDEGLDFEDVVQRLIEARDFDTEANKMDKAKRIQQLGY